MSDIPNPDSELRNVFADLHFHNYHENGTEMQWEAWLLEAEKKLAARDRRLELEHELAIVTYWHKQTIHEAPHPSDIRLTLHAQEDRIRELKHMLAALGSTERREAADE